MTDMRYPRRPEEVPREDRRGYIPPEPRVQPRSTWNNFGGYAFVPPTSAMPSLRRAVLLRGILMVIAGIAILALLVWKPLDVLAAFGILVGAFFAVAGIMRTVTGIVAGGLSAGMRALNIAIGVLVCVIGLIAMVSPGFGLMTLAIMVGVAWIFEGVAALSMLPQSRRGIWVFFGIVSLLAGLAIVALPWATVVPLVVLTGVALVLFGIVDTANGIRMGSDG